MVRLSISHITCTSSYSHVLTSCRSLHSPASNDHRRRQSDQRTQQIVVREPPPTTTSSRTYLFGEPRSGTRRRARPAAPAAPRGPTSSPSIRRRKALSRRLAGRTPAAGYRTVLSSPRPPPPSLITNQTTVRSVGRLLSPAPLFVRARENESREAPMLALNPH